MEFVETAWESFYDRSDAAHAAGSHQHGELFDRVPAAARRDFRRTAAARILLYLDGTQSLGALQFDVSRIRPDLFAVDAYKWLLSPNGAGFMYVSPELRERLAPAVIGWRSHRDWRNHENLHHGAPEFAAEAEKYEGGMLPVRAAVCHGCGG